MTGNQRLLWLVVLGTWLCSTGLAEDVTFTAAVDRNRLQIGEQFEITFTLSGSTGGSSFRPPSFEDFLVLSGPNQSTSMKFVNGVMSSSVSYKFILQPRSEGTFTIGLATIEAGGRKLQTQSVMVEVTKSTPRQQQRPTEESELSREIRDNLFLRVAVDKSRTYRGDQITATYKLYTRVSVVNYGITKVPAFTGFWSEDLEVAKQIQSSIETIEGKQYRVAVLRKVALFPQHTGTLSIDPMEVECVVQVQTRRRSNDFFDQFFSDPLFGNVTNVSQRVRSEPLKVTVLPLPSNAPVSFVGAVGKFMMDAWLDKRATKTNEPVSLKVRISGRGNLKLVEMPPIRTPSGLERYDPKISDNVAKQDDLISGSRTFEFLLIPRHAGDFRIPPFSFSYFDIERKSYVTLTSSELTLSVEQGTELAAGSGVGMRREDIRLLGEDIRFIKSGDVTFRRTGERFMGSPAYYALSIGPILTFIGLLYLMKRREKTAGDVTMWRRQRARRVARKRLAQAQKLLRLKKNEEFCSEVSRALWGYASDKLGIPVSELSTEFLKRTLESKGVLSETIDTLVLTLENCEFARFAPQSNSLQMEKMYSDATTLIATIESELR